MAARVLLSNLQRCWLLGPRLLSSRLSGRNIMTERHTVLTSVQGLENLPSSPSKKLKVSNATPDAAEISTLRVKKLVPDATLPKRGSAGAAGYDLARCALCSAAISPNLAVL